MATPITWRNINAPSFADSNAQFANSADLLSRGLGTLQTAAQREVDLRDPTSQLSLDARKRAETIEAFDIADAKRQFSQDLLGMVGSGDSTIDLNARINRRALELNLGSDAAAPGIAQVAGLREAAGITAPTDAQTAQNQLFQSAETRGLAGVQDWQDTMLATRQNELGYNNEIASIRSDTSLRADEVAKQWNDETNSSVGQDFLDLVKQQYKENGIKGEPTGAELQYIKNMAGYDNWSAWVSWLTDGKKDFDNGDVKNQVDAYLDLVKKNQTALPELKEYEKQLAERADPVRNQIQSIYRDVQKNQLRNRAAQYRGEQFNPILFDPRYNQQIDSYLGTLRGQTAGASTADQLWNQKYGNQGGGNTGGQPAAQSGAPTNSVDQADSPPTSAPVVPPTVQPARQAQPNESTDELNLSGQAAQQAQQTQYNPSSAIARASVEAQSTPLNQSIQRGLDKLKSSFKREMSLVEARETERYLRTRKGFSVKELEQMKKFAEENPEIITDTFRRKMKNMEALLSKTK